MTRRALALLLGFLAVSAHAAAAPPGPREVIQTLYGHYTKAGSAHWSLTDSMRVFDGSLRKLIDDDNARAAAAQEVPLLDYDPVCACQDRAGLQVRGITELARDAHAAQERADLYFTADHTHLSVTFRLVAQPEGWRIDDIKTPDISSLRAALVESLESGVE